jgi:RHS repeat-associated protein
VDRPSGAVHYYFSDQIDSVHYYFSDQIDSARVVTDAVGNIAQQSDYFPYGGEIVVTGSDPNHYKFSGKERDSESGLDNFGARYNASTMGRFMSPDPLGGKLVDPQTLNKYSYEATEFAALYAMGFATKKSNVVPKPEITNT